MRLKLKKDWLFLILENDDVTWKPAIGFLEVSLLYQLLLCIPLFYRGKQNEDDNLVLNSPLKHLYWAKCFASIKCFTRGLLEGEERTKTYGRRFTGLRAINNRELILRSSTGCVRDGHGPLLYPGDPVFPGDHFTWSEGRTDILPCALLGATWRS